MAQVQFYIVNGTEDDENADAQKHDLEKQGVRVHRQQPAIQADFPARQHNQGQGNQPGQPQGRKPAQQVFPGIRYHQVQDEYQKRQPREGKLRRQQIEIVGKSRHSSLNPLDWIPLPLSPVKPERRRASLLEKLQHRLYAGIDYPGQRGRPDADKKQD